MKHSPCHRRGIAGWYLVLLSLIMIGAATLVPVVRAGGIEGRRFLLLAPGAADVAYNIALFLPFGASLALVGLRVGTIAFYGATLSAVIELVQWLWIPSRYSSLSDIVANGLGAILGALILSLLPALIRPTPRVARRAVLLGGVAWGVVTATGAYLLQLDLPSTPAWWGQWAHTFASTVPLQGRVLAMTVNDLAVPDDSLANTVALQRAVTGEGLHLALTAENLGPVHGRAQVAALADGRGNLIVAVEQDGCTLRLVDRRRGEQYGLRMLVLNLPQFAACGTRDTVAIRASSTDAMMLLEVQGRHDSKVVVEPITPASSWRLLAPLPRAAGFVRPLTLLWLALFFVPLGYWARAAHRHISWLVLVMLFGAGTMGIAARAARITPPGMLELAGVVSATTLGWLVAGSLGLRRRAHPS